MENVLKREIEGRIRKLQVKLAEKEIDAAIIVQLVDLFYFTGSCQRGHLIVPADKEACYLVTKSFSRAKSESPLANIKLQGSFGELLAQLKALAPKAKRIGMEMDVLPVNIFLRYQKALSGLEIVDISEEIKKMRMRKSPYEIDIIKKGAELSRQMFEKVPLLLKAGKSEVEFAAEVESFLRSRGHQGGVRLRQFNQEVFFGHIMSGENITCASFFDGPTGGPGLSPAYPQSASWKKIEAGEPVLVDYVTALEGYNVDCTRLFSLGEPGEKLRQAHLAALQIQNEIVKAGKPGMPCSELYDMACEMAAELGYAESFMGIGPDKAAFIGHGVGLELDELPVLTAKHSYPLEEGMVFALEPKMVIPGVGVAGVENTVLVTASGLEKLTLYPEEITVV